jgi:hypothetical protein
MKLGIPYEWYYTFNDVNKKYILFFIFVGWAHKATFAPWPFLICCVSPPDF